MTDEIVGEFLAESTENLNLLDRSLVDLEKNPSDRSTLASVFRTIHTIKGTCGFLGFTKLEKVAHVGENLLSLLRDGQLQLTPEITTALLTMVDAIRQMLAEIQATEHDGDEEYLDLMQELTRLQKPGAPPAAPSIETAKQPLLSTVNGNAASPADLATPPPDSPTPQKHPANETAIPAHVAVYKASEAARKWPSFEKLGGVLVERGIVSPEKIAIALEEQEKGDKRRLGDILVALGFAKPEEVAVAQQSLEARTLDISAGTVRVGVNLLDNLMTLVGELVLVRNQLLQVSNSTRDSGLQSVSQRMNLIASELQEQVMKTRMQPMANVWNQFPRTVRDVATACGKEVSIEMEGQETELDKTIIEAIKDPLTHIVRNSVDHGIETPARRRAIGKPSEGRLLLRACHEGGQVIIEISDDGAGLDSEKLKRKAVEKGLISAEQAARMGEREAANLIFLPGFSTAEKVTNVSGRGVGMDVVKTNIEKIGGVVDVQSKPGSGATVRMKIPLTLAIIPALIVTSAGDRYAIPQISLLELVRLDGDGAAEKVELLQGVPVYRLRGRLLPLAYLNRELRMECAADQTKQSAVNIVVLQAEDRQFGLVVDEINDSEEIVVKPLAKQFKGQKAFAGSTIMGDGRVALIIDVPGIAHSANVVGESREHARVEKDALAGSSASDKQMMLLLRCGGHGCMAMDLSLVARLEKFKTKLIERAANQRVVQYRGQIMPLIWFADLLQIETSTHNGHSQDTIQVVVYSDHGRSVGLVVDQILDIVEEEIVGRQASKRPGLLGSAIIQQRVTDLLDVHAIVRAADLEMAEEEELVVQEA